MKWTPLNYVKIFDINFSKVSQKLAGYTAHGIKTWAQAKQAYNWEANGLAIFACGAGVVNATDPFEMARLRYELEQCLPPLEMTAQLREFVTAPTPPPALPIPFPQGLFTPLASPHSPPQEQFRFPDVNIRNGEQNGQIISCIKRRQLRVDQMFNNVVLGVEGRRMLRAGRREVRQPPVVDVSPSVAGPPRPQL